MDWCSVDASTMRRAALGRKENEGERKKNDLKIGRLTLGYECV